MTSLALPPPPSDLAFGDVHMTLETIVPAEPGKVLVPYYHFAIRVDQELRVGRINFRVGDVPQILRYAGHIGYAIEEAYRGRRYAFQACLAVRPVVRRFYDEVIITCDPDNAASKRTIEKLGCTFLEQVPVPPSEPAYARGSRAKLRYRWRVTD